MNSETGAPKSRKPLPRKRAEAQLRALYASVPDARTKASGISNVATVASNAVREYSSKAANYGARAGQVIAGNLGRGGDGKFTSAGNAAAKQPPSQRGRPSTAPERGAKPGAPTPAKAPTRTPARATATNRRRVAADLKKGGTGVGPKSMAALDALRNRKRGEKLSAEHLATLDILKKTGMVEAFEDGSFALTDAGKAFLDAADKGDAKAARAALTKKPAPDTKQPPAQKALTVMKDARGRWRWLTFSSTAFRDRDGEIVSTKALADDVARADTDGDYGPLRWWHVPGLDLGDCDFNAIEGRTLIESGTFRDERYGPLVAAKADELGVSLGFKHGPDQPDGDKVFHRIHRFERSLLPVAYPSNLYTALVVKESSTVDEKKIAGLKAIGFGDDDIAAIQAQAQAREKAAEAAGVTFKEADVAAPIEAAVALPDADSTPEPILFGDLTLDEAQAWLQQQNKPVLDALAGLAGQTATKAAREEETGVALKATQDALAQLQVTLKADREAVDAKLSTALKSIAELQGDVPSGIKRASQDAANIATKEQVDAFKGPAGDPMSDFLGFVTGSAG